MRYLVNVRVVATFVEVKYGIPRQGAGNRDQGALPRANDQVAQDGGPLVVTKHGRPVTEPIPYKPESEQAF